MQQDMQIKWLAIDELTEYENNPRNNDDAVEKVAASIREFGWRVPIVIDTDGVIAAGHTRVRAARSLGLDKVPCIVADDLTPEQVKAYRLVDNKTNELAKWDFGKLDKEMDELADRFDMTMFGFTDRDQIDIDSFFVDADPNDGQREKEPKRIQCPHCGEWFDA